MHINNHCILTIYIYIYINTHYISSHFILTIIIYSAYKSYSHYVIICTNKVSLLVCQCDAATRVIASLGCLQRGVRLQLVGVSDHWQDLSPSFRWPELS